MSWLLSSSFYIIYILEGFRISKRTSTEEDDSSAKLDSSETRSNLKGSRFSLFCVTSYLIYGVFSYTESSDFDYSVLSSSSIETSEEDSNEDSKVPLLLSSDISAI